MSQTPLPPPPPVSPYAYAAQVYAGPATGLATGALVLGIISIPTTCICIGPLLGLIAVILGLVAVTRAGSEPERYGGKGRAVGGIVTGGLSVATVVAFVALLSAAGTELAKAFPNVLGAAHTVIGLENVGKGLRAYYGTYGDYPPDLATLAAQNVIPPSPLPDAPPDPVASFTYVSGVGPTDPPHWIVAYGETQVFGHPLVVVLQASGATNFLEPAEFKQTLTDFELEYERTRGQPPRVLPAVRPATTPKAEAETEDS